MSDLQGHRTRALGLAVFVSACSPDPELDAWQGEYVVYESSVSLQVCKGTYARIDNFVPFVAGELGFDAPQSLNYRWLDAHDFEESECPNWSRGCSIGNQGLSEKPYLLHELAHAELEAVDHPYQPFFGEGIAVALDPWDGDGQGTNYLVPWPGEQELADPRPWMTMTAQDVPYGVAGSFVMFLLARHGAPKFLEFTRALGASWDMEVIEREFAEAYGVDLDAEAELFMVIDNACTKESFGPGVYDCTSPEVSWEGAAWSFSGVMDCASEEVAGGFGSEKAWPSIRSVTLEVPASGRYYLRADSDGEIGVHLGPCSSCPWKLTSAAVYSSEPVEVELEAGTHYVRIGAMSDEAPSFDIVLSPGI